MSTSFWKSQADEISRMFDKASAQAEEIIKKFKASEASEASEAEEEEAEEQKFIRYCQLGNLERVNEYLENRHQTFDQLSISYALYIASINGEISIVDRLLQENTPNKEEFTYNEILLYTIAENYVEIVDLLLKDRRVDPSANNNFAICMAKSKGLTEMVQCLLQDPRTRIFTKSQKMSKNLKNLKKSQKIFPKSQ
jgi:hypothetical protein